MGYGRHQKRGIVLDFMRNLFRSRTITNKFISFRSITHKVYSGDHTKVAVFGSIAEDGRRLFRTFTGSFTSVQFIECLEALRAKFGKVAVFCDRWSVHRSTDVAKYLAGHPDVRLIMIPRGSPYLNVVEECWNLLLYEN